MQVLFEGESLSRIYGINNQVSHYFQDAVLYLCKLALLLIEGTTALEIHIFSLLLGKCHLGGKFLTNDLTYLLPTPPKVLEVEGGGALTFLSFKLGSEF